MGYIGMLYSIRKAIFYLLKGDYSRDSRRAEAGSRFVMGQMSKVFPWFRDDREGRPKDPNHRILGFKVKGPRTQMVRV